MLSMVFGAGEGVEQVVVRVVGESDQQFNFTLLFKNIQLLSSVADPDPVSRIQQLQQKRRGKTLCCDAFFLFM